MERIRFAAEVSVRRALGFAGLGVGTAVMGLVYDPVLALKTGATLLALIAAVLFYKAYRAPTRNFKETEVWILLDRDTSLNDQAAQRVIGGVLRETYRRYAEAIVLLAGAAWISSIVVALLM